MVNALTQFEALMKAIDIVGTQTALARECDVSVTTVWKWVKSAKRVSAEYVLRVEAASGVSRHALRPDIYPPEIDLALPPSAIGEPFVECGPILSAQALSQHGNCGPALSRRGAA